MTTRAMGPGAGWSWLKRAINLGSHNPKAIFGAAGLLLAVGLVPTLLQILVQNGLGMTDAGAMTALIGFSVVYSVLVMPPMIGGFLRIIHATESGAATRATAIFDVFKPGGGAPRIIALIVLLLLLVVVLFGIVGAAFGTEFMAQLAAVVTAMQSATPGTPPALPPLPDGVGILVAVMVLLGLFFNGVYAISVGQVVLTTRGIGGALGDGLVGTLKNLLPLLVLLLIAVLLGFAFLLALGLIVALLAFVGGLVHPVLGVALAAPAYLIGLLLLYVIMFGVMYFMWRDICGDAAVASAPVAAGNQVEL